MSLPNLAGTNYVPGLAGAAIIAGRMVKQDSTAGRFIHTTGIGDIAVGVAVTDAAAAGDPITIQILGWAKCTASAAITMGDKLMLTGSGAGKVSLSSGAANEVGVALQTVANDGEMLTVALAVPNVERIANA